MPYAYFRPCGSWPAQCPWILASALHPGSLAGSLARLFAGCLAVWLLAPLALCSLAVSVSDASRARCSLLAGFEPEPCLLSPSFPPAFPCSSRLNPPPSTLNLRPDSLRPPPCRCAAVVPLSPPHPASRTVHRITVSPTKNPSDPQLTTLTSPPNPFLAIPCIVTSSSSSPIHLLYPTTTTHLGDCQLLAFVTPRYLAPSVQSDRRTRHYDYPPFFFLRNKSPPTKPTYIASCPSLAPCQDSPSPSHLTLHSVTLFPISDPDSAIDRPRLDSIGCR